MRKRHESNAFEPSNVERVTARAEQTAEAMCNIATPTTALEAKFSLRLMTAAARLRADTSGLALYQDASVRDAPLSPLHDKVTVEFVNDWPKMQSEVIVERTDGRSLSAIHDAGVAPTAYVQQGQRLRETFLRLAEPVLGRARSEAVLQLVQALEGTSVPDLMKACAPAGQA